MHYPFFSLSVILIEPNQNLQSTLETKAAALMSRNIDVAPHKQRHSKRMASLKAYPEDLAIQERHGRKLYRSDPPSPPLTQGEPTPPSLYNYSAPPTDPALGDEDFADPSLDPNEPIVAGNDGAMRPIKTVQSWDARQKQALLTSYNNRFHPSATLSEQYESSNTTNKESR